MAESRTSRKVQRLQRKVNKKTAKRNLIEKTAEPSAEERLAALHALQRLVKQRRIDFHRWLQTISDGRR
jgi:hypothetical protein